MKMQTALRSPANFITKRNENESPATLLRAAATIIMLAAAAEALAPSQQLERLDLERQELTVIKENFLSVACPPSLRPIK